MSDPTRPPDVKRIVSRIYKADDGAPLLHPQYIDDYVRDAFNYRVADLIRTLSRGIYGRWLDRNDCPCCGHRREAP